MKTYDLYGWTTGDLDVARRVTEETLGLRLKRHESMYRGGDYYRADQEDGEHLILQLNEELDEELAEPDLSTYGVLLRVEGTTRAEAIEARLMNADQPPELLRRSRV